MSKRYKHRRTISGLRSGKRIKWLTLPGAIDAQGEKLNHYFAVVRINEEGKLEFVEWTGQIGLSTIKGEVHHTLPSNALIHEDRAMVMVYSMFAPFGHEVEVANMVFDGMNKQMERPLLNWYPAAGMERGKLKMEMAPSVSDLIGPVG